MRWNFLAERTLPFLALHMNLVPLFYTIHGLDLYSFKKFKKQKLELKLEQIGSSRHLFLSIKVKKVLFRNHFEPVENECFENIIFIW